MFKRSLIMGFVLVLLISCEQVTSRSTDLHNNEVATTTPEPKAFTAEYSYSDVSSKDQYLLGEGYEIASKAVKGSGLTSFDQFEVSSYSLISKFGQIRPSTKLEILQHLPTTYNEDYNSFYETQFRYFGIDQKAVNFIDSIKFDSRSVTIYHFAVGQSALSRLCNNEVMEPELSTAVKANNLASVSSKYGDSYVREITKGFIAFYVMNISVDESSDYSFDTVLGALNTLDFFGYSAGTSYTESDLQRDWAILRSKGVNIKVFAFTNLSKPGIGSVVTPHDFDNYWNSVGQNNLLALSSPIRIGLWSYSRLK